MIRPKPRIVQDIRTKMKAFDALKPKINLGYSKVRRIPLTRMLQYGVTIGAIVFFFLSSVIAPTLSIRAADAPQDRAALEAQLQDLESQINQYEDQVVGYQKQGQSLKGEIGKLNGQIAKLNLQIQAINLTLGQLDKKIGETQVQISSTEQSIQNNKQVLSDLIQSLYQTENTSLLEIFLAHPHISDFFSDMNSFTLLQDNVRVTIGQIADLRNQLQDKQDQFALARADAASVKSYQAVQKQEIDAAKSEKNKLLAVTKGQESKYQSLLKQTQATAAQIRSRIFQLLGGGELSFEQAYSYAKLAAGATGIRPALLLAVLDRESALGQNVGKCNYKTAMSPSNQTIFIALTTELHLNPDIMHVSCPNRDGVYGGAMGPAQFVPATWQLYSDHVAQVTQNNPPSPWDNADAFVATALYLKDSNTGCASVYSSSLSRERCVAAKYYAGARWRSYLWTYGEAVVSRAEKFQEDINTITSGGSTNS